MSRPTQVLSYVVLLFSPTGLSPSLAGLPSTVRLTTGFLPTTQGIMHCPTESPTTPMMQLCIHITHHRFGLFPVRSPLLRESRFDFFSSGYLDGSLPRVFPYYTYFIQYRMSYLLI